MGGASYGGGPFPVGFCRTGKGERWKACLWLNVTSMGSPVFGDRGWTGRGRVSTSRDTDLVSRARLIQALGWALFPGVFMGGATAYILGRTMGLGPTTSVVVSIVACVVFTLFCTAGALFVSHLVGSVTNVLVHPRSQRRPPDYSHAASLRARGMPEKAIEAYSEAIAEAPQLPAPYLEIARTYRDELGDSSSALTWMRKAGREAVFSENERRAWIREVVGLGARHPKGERIVKGDVALYLEGEAESLGDDAWARRELEYLKTVEYPPEVERVAEGGHEDPHHDRVTSGRSEEPGGRNAG